MATHDYIISNASGASVRADLNNALAAIVSNNSNATSPATTYAYQWWADTTTGQLKLRNSANSAWITIFELDGTMLMEDGTVSAPGLAFASDLNTGFFRSAADKINFATGGAERLEIGSSEVVFNDPSNDVDFRVESNGNSHMLFVDAGNDRIGIGTSSPGRQLQINGDSDTQIRVVAAAGGVAGIQFGDANDSVMGGVNFDASDDSLQFRGFNNSEAMRIDSSGNVGIGVTNPGAFNAKAETLVLANGGDHVGITFDCDTDKEGSIYFADGASGDNLRRGQIVYNHDGDSLRFVTNASERMRLDSSGNVGIGTTSPSAQLESQGDVSSTTQFSGFQALRIQNSNGSAFGVSADINFVAGTGSNNRGAVIGAVYTSANSGNDLYFATNGSAVTSNDTPTERMRIDSSGNVGIGTSSIGYKLHLQGTNNSDAGDVTLRVEAGSVSSNSAVNNAVLDLTARGKTSGGTALFQNCEIRSVGRTNPGGELSFHTDDTSNVLQERLRIDSSGQLLVGTSSSPIAGDINSAIVIKGSADGTYSRLILARNDSTITSGNNLGLIEGYSSDGGDQPAASITFVADGTHAADNKPGRIVFSTTASGSSSPTERMRIDKDGNLMHNCTVTNPGAGNTSTGTAIEAASDGGTVLISRTGNIPLYLNRNTDGVLLNFNEDGNNEGSISVSGSTVSYNGGHLSRWSQLAGNAERTEILRGSVLSNLDEMCEWGEENNEQLNRMKVSDVEGDVNVSGVFQAWDDDDDTYINDFYCAMTGDFVIRVAQSTTVARGDLLMSAGDGTAKPQDDDIVRSKTIAKVTSTTVSTTYSDGSYCVPCVLMAC